MQKHLKMHLLFSILAFVHSKVQPAGERHCQSLVRLTEQILLLSYSHVQISTFSSTHIDPQTLLASQPPRGQITQISHRLHVNL